MQLEGRQVIVVGLGRSGIAAARLCAARGARVVAADAAPLERLAAGARELDAEVVAGGYDGVDFAQADLIVVSPGVPPFPRLEAAEAAGAQVIGELELAWRFLDAPLALVGGTNGKSTTTTLLGHLVAAGGARTFVGGNLGTPLSEAVDGDWEALVVEASSFQLERAPTLRPRVSLLLNISEDHLDRYPDLAAYARAKGNAFVNQTPDDIAVIPAGDRLCAQQAARGRGRVVTFGEGGDYAVDGREVVEHAGGERFSLEGSDLHGRHNLDNAAAAVAAAREFGVSRQAVADGLARFRALPHRMALAGVVDGITFYDDSKGTNVGAAVTALSGLTEPRGVLIAGGRDKLGSYEPLVAALEHKGRALVVIGEAAERIAAAVGERVPVERAQSMSDAVERAYRLARPGDAVLLSPACSSFDMFENYAERGDRFVEAVENLAARPRRTEAR